MATLGKKLLPLLSWGADLYLLSEVRTPWAQQKTLMRLAKAKGYSLLFSPPPPPSPTFSCSPGGVALAAKEHIALRKIFPPTLQRWYEESRLCVCLMTLGDFAAIIVSVYAYPRSNPRREANEEMFTDLFGWMSTLTMPILLGGDFNEARDESSSLSLIYRLDLSFLSSSLPTTRSKTGTLSRGQAIDHCIGNTSMKECLAWAEPNYERSLSDHFPLEGTFMCEQTHHQVWHWPAPLRLDKTPLDQVVWTGQPRTYAEWCSIAHKWLCRTYQTHGDNKMCVTSSPAKKKCYQPDATYQAICSAQRTLRHIHLAHSPSETQMASFKRKLIGLGLEFVSPEKAQSELSDYLKDYLAKEHKAAIKIWRDKAAKWSVSARQLYSFVRNPD